MIRPPDSERFRKWFSGSYALDANAQPLQLFHGTASQANIQSLDALGANASTCNGDSYGVGVYLTSCPREASWFAKATGCVYPVYARGKLLRLDGELDASEKIALSEFATRVALPSDRSRFGLCRLTKTFADANDARAFFESQQENWRAFGDGMCRAKPEVQANGEAFDIVYTDFDAPIQILTGQDAMTLFKAIGWNNLIACDYDGLIMRRDEDGPTLKWWVVMHRPAGNIKSATGNSGLYCPFSRTLCD